MEAKTWQTLVSGKSINTVLTTTTTTTTTANNNNHPALSSSIEDIMSTTCGGEDEDDRDPLLVDSPQQGRMQGLLQQLLEFSKGEKKVPPRRLVEEIEEGTIQQHLDLTLPQQQHPGGKKEERTCHSLGILLASISCIFFATSALIVKVSTLHPMQLLCVRGVLQMILILPIVLLNGHPVLGLPGTRKLLFARAALGSISLMLSFASINMISLGDAATLIFTAPVFVSIFACIFLGEACGGFEVTMIILTLSGVVLVSQPSFDGVSSGSLGSILGTACGLGAAVTMAAALTVLRQLKGVHFSVTVLWFSVVLAGLGAVMTLSIPQAYKFPSEWPQILDCFGIGICGFFGQVLLTKALQLEHAGPCAVARTLDIVLAFFYQITLLQDTPHWYSYLGSFFVVSSVLLTAFRRWYVEKYLVVQQQHQIQQNNATTAKNSNNTACRA